MASWLIGRTEQNAASVVLPEGVQRGHSVGVDLDARALKMAPRYLRDFRGEHLKRQTVIVVQHDVPLQAGVAGGAAAAIPVRADLYLREEHSAGHDAPVVVLAVQICPVVRADPPGPVPHGPIITDPLAARGALDGLVVAVLLPPEMLWMPGQDKRRPWTSRAGVGTPGSRALHWRTRE
jgi:hypothetical protein